MTTTALLGVMILLVGMLKIPSPVAGGEFQLSAPLAVLICAYFGFRRYFMAGILASILGLVLGTANIFNVMIALIFRLVVGGIIVLGGPKLPVLIVSGPLGTAAARIAVSQLLHIDWLVLVFAAVPGMLATAIVVALAYKPGKALIHKYAIIKNLEQIN